MNIKPDWKYAPEWANYAAMDADGAWWWYECRPDADFVRWYCGDGGGFCEKIRDLYDDDVWKNSLTERPSK